MPTIVGASVSACICCAGNDILGDGNRIGLLAISGSTGNSWSKTDVMASVVETCLHGINDAQELALWTYALPCFMMTAFKANDISMCGNWSWVVCLLVNCNSSVKVLRSCCYFGGRKFYGRMKFWCPVIWGWAYSPSCQLQFKCQRHVKMPPIR